MIDRHVVLTVVCFIGAVALILVLGIVHMAGASKQLDAGVTALAGSSIGYLGGLLTNVTRNQAAAPPPAADVPPVPDPAATKL